MFEHGEQFGLFDGELFESLAFASEFPAFFAERFAFGSELRELFIHLTALSEQVGLDLYRGIAIASELALQGLDFLPRSDQRGALFLHFDLCSFAVLVQGLAERGEFLAFGGQDRLLCEQFGGQRVDVLLAFGQALLRVGLSLFCRLVLLLQFTLFIVQCDLGLF